MERFEVGSAVQVCRGNSHEVDVIGHNLTERVPVVFVVLRHKILAAVCSPLLHLLWIGRGHSRLMREETIKMRSVDISSEFPF